MNTCQHQLLLDSAAVITCNDLLLKLADIQFQADQLFSSVLVNVLNIWSFMKAHFPEDSSYLLLCVGLYAECGLPLLSHFWN